MARKGDLITVNPARVGQLPRQGEIIEVIEGDLRVRYRVRWNDGHESLFAPSAGGVRIEPARGKALSGTETKKSPAKAAKARKASVKKSAARKSSGRK